MTEAEILARASDVQAHWGGTGTPVLIGHRENAVFKVATGKGPIALRLHRTGYQTHDHITGEMVWMEGLSQHGFPCPRPVRTHNKELIVTLDDGQMATAVTWIDAAPIGTFKGTAAEHVSLYFDLGKLLSKLHRLTDQLATDIARPSWDISGLLGDAPLWDRFWENPGLTSAEADIVRAARVDATQNLRDVDGLDFGLIHADALQENVLTDGQLHLIDFDDSGYGYRKYELAVALIQHENAPNLPALTEALCEGYGTTTEHMPLFLMLRGMASAGWIMSRADASAPQQRRYIERMLRRIEAYRAHD